MNGDLHGVPWLLPLLPRAFEAALFCPAYHLLTWQILLDQRWQCWFCRTHLPTDISIVVHWGLTVVCIVNSYKLGDSAHSPVVWENQRPGGMSWCPTTQQWSELSRGRLSRQGLTFPPPGYEPFVLLDFICRTSYLLVSCKLLSFLQPLILDFHLTSSSGKPTMNTYSSEPFFFHIKEKFSLHRQTLEILEIRFWSTAINWVTHFLVSLCLSNLCFH